MSATDSLAFEPGLSPAATAAGASAVPPDQWKLLQQAMQQQQQQRPDLYLKQSQQVSAPTTEGFINAPAAALGATIGFMAKHFFDIGLMTPTPETSAIAKALAKIDTWPLVQRANNWLNTQLALLGTPDWLKTLLVQPKPEVLGADLLVKESEAFVQKHAARLKAFGLNDTWHKGVPLADFVTKAEAHWLAPLKAEAKKRGTTHWLNPFKPAAEREVQTLLKDINGLLKRQNMIAQHMAEHALEQKITQTAGPLTRVLATGVNIFRRVFGGTHVLEMGGAASPPIDAFDKISRTASKNMGGAMQGMFLFGLPLYQAYKADGVGEKVRSFMYELLGPQLFAFAGWELGSRVLTATGLVSKLLGSVASKRLLMGTWGGFATLVLSQVLFGGALNKLGNAVATAIFGEPEHVYRERVEASQAKHERLTKLQQAQAERRQERLAPAMPPQQQANLSLKPVIHQPVIQRSLNTLTLPPQAIASSVSRAHGNELAQKLAVDTKELVQDDLLLQSYMGAPELDHPPVPKVLGQLGGLGDSASQMFAFGA